MIPGIENRIQTVKSSGNSDRVWAAWEWLAAGGQNETEQPIYLF